MDAHFEAVVNAIADGRVIPFLGAGANLCGRANGVAWNRGQQEHLPSGKELIEHLITRFSYPTSEAKDLARVTQYVDTIQGQAPLFQELHELFDRPYPPTELHRLFAELPQLLRAKNCPRTSDPFHQRLLVVSTNYDDLMERAFDQAGEKYHVLTYMTELVDRAESGMFLHAAPDRQEAALINTERNQLTPLDNDQYPVIIKIHGAVDRVSLDQTNSPFPYQDSFVITEDHYIDYLSLKDVLTMLPITIRTQLIKSNYLFLGYSLRDWNLRAILRRIWREQGRMTYRSWAILLDATDFERRYWISNRVEIHEVNLSEYTRELGRRLRAL